MENIKKLVNNNIKVIPRLPIIPNYTMDIDNYGKLIDYVSSLGLTEIHLLPYHKFGTPKYSLLKKEWIMEGVHTPTEKQMSMLKSMAEKMSLKVIVGG